MLIAILSASVEKNIEVEEQIIQKEHLRFIITNWWMEPLEQEKKKIMYLVAAFLNEEEEEEVEILQDLQEDITELKNQDTTELETVLNEIKKIKQKV